MNCPKCGAQMLPGAGFCGGCGYRVDAQAGAQSSPQGGSYAGAQGIHIDQDSRGQGRGYSY